MRPVRKNQDSNFVRYSRAGDAFHYRWAARRCLRMIDRRCPVFAITIEASQDPNMEGECAIDLAEYAELAEGGRSTHYVQLKHSSVRKNKPLGLTELGKTLLAFAKRYAEHIARDRVSNTSETISFSLVTNRQLGTRLVAAFDSIRRGDFVSIAQRQRLEKATKLSDDSLRSFFASLSVVDGEGDYIVQHEELHGELAEFLAGFVDSSEVDNIVSLVSERALPHTVKQRRKGEILREDVLQRLGVTSDRDLFPAPREFEAIQHLIRREQHENLMSHILQATTPVIIHAAGGVGKSVVACQIAESLPKGSLGLVYDCFGSGKYRNPSEPRHRPCDALIQIANELAAAGYCRTLIAHHGTPADALFRSFLERLTQAVQTLREIEPNALLVILIDAADNAEMAAQENIGDQCFASGLLRVNLPEGCRLVALCRTERREMLKAKSTVQQLALNPFSEAETAAHLRSKFPSATDYDVKEFHRLTGENPRVQAIALHSGQQSLEEILANLGPAVTTVAAQIEAQLHLAVSGIKDRSITDVSRQVDSICLGLANLPPFIPVTVLAKAAQVEESTIHSFVSDLGHPLWHSDTSVMFRDEPTETWFREQFAADTAQIKRYVAALEPLAKDFPYVAKALPQLLLKSEDYARLVELALSDDFLPENNPIDARNIRVYRLQFAFRAALRLGRTADAVQLAFRAGEEVAGDQRQLHLLRQNVDIIAPLLDPTRVQELAYRQLLSGGWPGSKNIYSASLLSSVDDFKGEARGYLRAAEKWLTIFFEERSKRREHDQYHEILQDADLAEMAWAHFNLGGVDALVEFLLGWKPPQVTFRLSRLVVRRLVDAARFDEIDKLALYGHKNTYLILAVADELESVARFPPKDSLKAALSLLARKGLKTSQDSFNGDISISSIVSLCEACAARGLPKARILAVLENYTNAHATARVGSNFEEGARSLFLRGIALRAVLKGEAEPAPKTLLPPKDTQPIGRTSDKSEEENLIQVMGGLMPWHYLRARFIAHDPAAPAVDLEQVRAAAKSSLTSRYRTHDHIPYEISVVRFSVLALKTSVTELELQQFTQNVVARAAQKFTLNRRLDALHTACRVSHLAPLRSALEQSCVANIEPVSSETPEERADSYIKLARAVFALSRPDAAAYFERAIDAVSKFGDEMVPRWQAMVAVANRTVDGGKSCDKMAYRFFKCAEMVGESVMREKYWSRDEVFRTGVRMHAPGAFAAMSRWRDREVGWFDGPMLGLATEAVNSGQVAALPGWCLSGFLACNTETEFATTCIRHEPDQLNRQYIFNAAIRDLELAGTKRKSWLAMEAVAKEFSLDQGRLIPLLALNAEPIEQTTTLSEPSPIASYRKQLQHWEWDVVFNGVDVLTSAGIALAEAAYQKTESPFAYEEFWSELLRRVPAGRETEFLEMLPLAESVDSHDVSYLLISLRLHWMEKAAVKLAWPRFLRSIGKRWAAPLAETGHLEYWLQRGSLTEQDSPLIKVGIVQGLAESLDLVDSRTFFGFIASVATDLTPAESAKLLDYAMTRFELHIDSDFGDGPWAPWLAPPAATTDALTGLIWSALGSPLSATRWQAVHCIRRLVEAGCDTEIDSLFGWLQRDAVDAFGSHRFPFYRLHAQLYLLIALARTACDTPERLHRHVAIFASLALTGIPHILIQKFAADIALAIERVTPGTYSEQTRKKLQCVGHSPFPIKEVDGYPGAEDTPWHARGEVNTDLKVHFGLDFDCYWFKYLGDIFGVSQQHAIDLGREAAVSHMGIVSTDDYQPDPRRHLWESRDYYARGTSHSHSSYPQNDDYRFYYSYHSFLFAATRLLGAMPVICRKDGYEADPWGDWLRRHLLTRTDGHWLADRRDPSPVKRRAWAASSRDENWQWRVASDDFLDLVLHQCPHPQWLCLSGRWTECENDRIERICISSAFVTPETADALANSLRGCWNPMDYRLPYYEDEIEQCHEPPFELIGWINREDGRDKRLDGFDPYAREISYPPYQLGESFAADLGLVADSEKRAWRRSAGGEPLFISELWSEKELGERDRVYREGARICGAIAELTRLCALLNKELLFSIEFDRRLHRYHGSSSDDIDFIPDSHKIFILSANGKLRDAHQSHQVG